MSETQEHTRNVRWARVDAAFYVASCDGSFLGTVDAQFGPEHTARDSHSCLIGQYADLRTAMDAVAARAEEAGTL